MSNNTLTLKDLMGLKSKFLTIISRYRIVSRAKEDVLYDFYYKMLKPSEVDGKNYLERWNGTTALSTWFYKPLKNYCYSLKQRELSKGGLSITHAASIVEASEREQEFDGTVLFLENHAVAQPDVSDTILVHQLLDLAKAKYSSCHSRSSKGYPRSPYFVVACLYNGLTKAQTSTILEVSTTFVDSLLKKFMRDVEVQQIKQEYIVTK